VQSVFDDVRSEHHQKMLTNLEERLTQAVKDGKINDTQKQAILKKFSEMNDKRYDFEKYKDMTQEERRSEMEKKRTEMEAWAKENGLTLETLHDLMRHGKRMFGGHGMKGMWIN
jgi:type I site-specific restriction-modification system R (restriction) subunit